MTVEWNKQASYTNISALNDLRRQARDNPEQTLRDVAQQFEALYIKMMLKSMRDASFGDALFDNSQSDFYRDMHDQEMALHLSKGSGLGLADLMVQQLSRTLPEQIEPTANLSPSSTALSDSGPSAQFMHVTDRASLVAAAQATKQPLTGSAESAPRVDSPVEFVQELWPLAVDAAGELGTTPAVLLAQAALETGWGRAVQQHPDGSSSYNLFNIKADSRWDAKRLQTDTLEFEAGVPVQRRASFRAYDSYAESFSDYVRFVKENPRYQEALDKAADPEAYIDALHRAGYATDPEYAQKIKGILQRDLWDKALAANDMQAEVKKS